MGTAPSETSAQRSSSTYLTALIAVVVVAVVIVFAASADSWYLFFKSIHVTFAVIWIGGGVLLTLLGILAERRRDPDELATIARQASFVGEKVFTPAALVVLVMGIAMMINGDLDWGQFWIDFGLLGFLSTFALGIGVLAPSSKRVVRLVAAQGTAAPETQAAIAKLLVVARVDIAVLLLVVFDMVLKPFS